jgi:hypothetical protein
MSESQLFLACDCTREAWHSLSEQDASNSLGVRGKQERERHVRVVNILCTSSSGSPSKESNMPMC